MGHTVWSQRIVIEVMLSELKNFAKALQQKDRAIYESMLKKPFRYVSKISYTSSVHTWAFLLLNQ